MLLSMFRIFWVLSIIISISGCSLLVSKVYIKWEENPVIVSVNEIETPIWTIPFPAVTICPEIKFKSSLFNLSDTKNHILNTSLTEQQVISQNALYPICPLSQQIEYQGKIDFVREIKKLSILPNEIFSSCGMGENSIHCSKIFSTVLTDDGICFTSNMLNFQDLFAENVDKSIKFPRHRRSSANWTLQDGYKTFDSETYPMRILGSGIQAGLSIYLIANKTDIEYRCRGYSQGFKIALHLPNEVPRFSKQFTKIAFNRQVLINLVPEVVITSDVLKSYKPDVRKCYFDGEKSLKYFKSYTKSNCDLECLTNFTQLTCGCVMFGMPFDNNTEICSFESKDCSSLSESFWLNKKLNHYLEKELFRDKQMLNGSNISSTDCNCLPSCSSIVYKAEISEGAYSIKEYLNSFNLNHLDDQ